jgi:hypothetical protein
MKKYSASIATTNGSALEVLSTATVTVTLAGTATVATLYSTNAGAAKANPFQSTTTGLIEFYAADGRYDITVSKAGYTTVVISDVLFEDPTDLVDDGITGVGITLCTLDSTPIGGTTPALGGFTGVQLSTGAPAANAVGRFTWNDTDGTADLRLKGGNVTLQVGQENVARVVNKTGVAFTEMQAVYVVGAQGQRLSAALALATTDATSSRTFAIVTEPIANNAEGFVTTSGLVRDVNTSAFSEGDSLWLSASTAGAVTNVRPTAPNHGVLLGWCVISNHSNGSIFVHVQNGFEIGELHDVLITAPADKQHLQYESATGLWKNSSTGAFTALSASTSITSAGAIATQTGGFQLVSGVAGGTTPYIQASTTGGAAAPLNVYIGGTVAATLDTSGNLGIGTVPSAWGSNYKAIDFGGNSGIASYSNQLFSTSNAYADNTNFLYKASTFATLYLQGSGSHNWYTAPSGTAGNAITFKQTLSINASGSLQLFSATTAAAPAYVKGAMYFDTTLNKLRIGGATAWETVTSV